MENIPEVRRRGRPPIVKAEAGELAPELLEQAPEATAAPSKRRRRDSVGGHAMKLSAPPRPGFVRRFFNDAGNRLAEAQELGYDFVEDTGIQTHDPSSRINRLAGTQANGAPLKTYLMETPVELYAEGVAEKEAQHASVDKAIREGRDSTGSGDLTQGQGSIQVER